MSSGDAHTEQLLYMRLHASALTSALMTYFFLAEQGLSAGRTRVLHIFTGCLFEILQICCISGHSCHVQNLLSTSVLPFWHFKPGTFSICICK